jgi:hypothetical protein
MLNLSMAKLILSLLVILILMLMLGSVYGQVTFINVQPEIGEEFNDSPYGGAWGDIDNDGDLDMYITVGTHKGHDLMINDLSVSGKFIRADTTMAHFLDTGAPRAAVMADFENDGDLDILTTAKLKQVWLVINKLADTDSLWFEEMSEATGIAHVGEYYYGAALADYDNDGNLDIFLAGMSDVDWFPSLLYRNISPVSGPLAFEELSEQAGIFSVYGLGMIGGFWGDYDGDGDQDIFVTNWQATPDFLYRNEGDGTFSDVTLDMGMEDAIGNTRFAVWGDFDNDCDLDIFIGRTKWAEAPNMDISQLYRNDGSLFTEIESARLISKEIYGISTADYDNDGDLDIHLLNAAGTDFLLRNDGDFSFVNVVEDAGLAEIEAPGGWGMMGIDDRGCPTWADWDVDGDLDILLPAEVGVKPFLMQNNGGNDNNWLQLKLTGIQSNRSAVGARIIAITDGLKQMREIHVGTGYSSPPLDVHFGFGQRTAIDSLIIRWPSGIIDVLTNVAVNQILSIEEGSGSTGVDIAEMKINTFELYQNYPNPFNPTTSINFTLQSTNRVELKIFNSMGQSIRTFQSKTLHSGTHSIEWDGKNDFGNDVVSGIYFYKLKASDSAEGGVDFSDTKKMILIR